MKFTESRDGKLRATIAVRFRIDKPLYDWLVQRLGKAGAERALRDALQSKGNELLDWHVPVFSLEDKDVEWVQIDHRGDYRAEEGEVEEYEVFGETS